MVPQCLGSGRITADIGRQLLPPQQYLGADHTGCGPQRSFDLAQFDAQSAQFHLVIAASQVLHRPVVAPSGAVPCPVQSATGHMGIVEETLGGKIVPPEVAAGQLYTAQVQIARHACRKRPQQRIQHVQAGVPDREADGHRLRCVVAPRRPPTDIHRRLGGSIQVVQVGPHACMEAVAQACIKRFTTGEDMPQHQPARFGNFQERIQHRGHEVRRGDALGTDQPSQRLRVAMQPGRGDHQRAAADQWQEELPHRHVERRRRLLQDAIVFADAIVRAHPQQPVDDGAMLDEHAFGFAGRSGGVDHVGRILRLHGIAQGGIVLPRPLRR